MYNEKERIEKACSIIRKSTNKKAFNNKSSEPSLSERLEQGGYNKEEAKEMEKKLFSIIKKLIKKEDELIKVDDIETKRTMKRIKEAF